jgi:phosphatidylserine/phosphatidylglycerophosphate/cardiolipin synthase-like enzyme
MTEIITNPFYDDFLKLCAGAQSSVKLCAPFVKTDIISDVLSVKRDSVSVNLVTKIDLKNYHTKASDVQAMAKIIESSGKVFNCSNLHAKVYIFDNRTCLITSANLTTAGLKRNVECGIISGDNTIVESAVGYFDKTERNNHTGKITDVIVSEITEILSKIPQAPSIHYPKVNLSDTLNKNLTAITETLSGWKRSVFLALMQFEETFTSADVSIVAAQLAKAYPNNHHREEKVRQTLQKLRDLGLIEFTLPGVYKKLWD